MGEIINKKSLVSPLSRMILVISVVTMACAGEDRKENVVAINQHAKVLKSVDQSIVNDLPKWLNHVKAQEKEIRLKAASNLLICSLIDPERMKHEKVGDKIVLAYEQEYAVEVKMAMLSTLDVLEHPSLTNLLAKAAQSDDPLVRNLVVLIEEKRYLEPVITENPDIKRR